MKKSFLLISLAALLFSCSSDEDFQDTSSYVKVSKVSITADPFVFENAGNTRVAWTVSQSGMDFAWSKGDSLGIFPIDPAGSQVYQVLGTEESSSGGTLNFTFDGGAWVLRKGNTYSGYHPFNKDMKMKDTYKDVPVNLVGQKQNGNSSTDHLGRYDYMYTEPTLVDESTETIDLHFHQALSIIQVQLTVPAAASWKKLVFEAENDVFVTTAKMDATTGDLSSQQYSNTFELGLENVTSTAANQTLIFYIMVAPTTTGAVKVSAVTTDNKYYVGNLSSMNIRKGIAYQWITSLTEADEYAGKDYVLLAGSLWCRYNLNISGATGGEYYAWAETTTKTTYEWSNYKFGSSADNISLYRPSDGYSTILPQHDVARRNMAAPGDGYWRIPTKEEFEKLISLCTWTWDNSTSSYKISDPDNSDRFIYLPTTSAFGDELYSQFDEGFYWTSDVSETSTNWSNAHYLYFNDTDISIDELDRCYGLMIRPVYIP